MIEIYHDNNPISSDSNKDNKLPDFIQTYDIPTSLCVYS